MLQRVTLTAALLAVLVVGPASSAGAVETCFGSAPTIIGTPGDDFLVGTTGDDVIVGLGGNDYIDGRGGHDLLCGGPGNDDLDGGAGDDKLDGGAQDDWLNGGAGNLIGLGDTHAQLTFADPDSTSATASKLHYDDLTMRFFLSQQALKLTPNQFRLLRFLYQNRHQVCTREQCAVAVWGASYAPGMEATTLDQVLSTLRGAIRKLDPDAPLIDTRPGLGFQLADSA